VLATHVEEEDLDRAAPQERPPDALGSECAAARRHVLEECLARGREPARVDLFSVPVVGDLVVIADGHDGGAGAQRAILFTRIQCQPAPEPKRAKRPYKPLCARSPGGLELHADVFIAAHDRAALLRICRYMARPPIPQDRLSWRPDGRLVMSLKRTWKSGVKAVVFEPLALIARLAALVPTPYMHLRRFYGIFAPRHRLRAHIVPTPPDPASAAAPVAP